MKHSTDLAHVHFFVVNSTPLRLTMKPFQARSLTMLLKQMTVLCLSVLSFACGAQTSSGANDYPNKPIHFTVSFGAGSSTDIVTRLLAQKLTERLGQPVLVEQRIGSGGLIGNEYVSKQPPDGLNMVLLTGGHPASVAILNKLPYDPIKDFGMVSTIVTYPMVVSVSKDSPIKTFGELIVKAKTNPGQTSFSSIGSGSLHHLLGEWINIEAGVDMLHVPFKGAPQAFNEIMGGRVDTMIETATFSFGQIKGGKLRGLAVSSKNRSPLMPEIPTVSETLPGIEFSSWLGVVVSPGTPRPIVDKLNHEFRLILESQDFKQKFAEFGGVPIASSPEEMKSRIEVEIARWRHIVELKHIERQ
jgi:tripartite-type tricarboxylate transporter receptor subunit TctC